MKCLRFGFSAGFRANFGVYVLISASSVSRFEVFGYGTADSDFRRVLAGSDVAADGFGLVCVWFLGLVRRRFWGWFLGGFPQP